MSLNLILKNTKCRQKKMVKIPYRIKIYLGEYFRLHFEFINPKIENKNKSNHKHTLINENTILIIFLSHLIF